MSDPFEWNKAIQSLDRVAAEKRQEQSVKTLEPEPDMEVQVAMLKKRVAILEAGICAIDDLIADSRGVAGLHLNGDVATWDELRTGGRFEEWLLAFDKALKLLPRIEVEAEESPVEQDEEETLEIRYCCPMCKFLWVEWWVCACDSTCPKCGQKDVQALSWKGPDDAPASDSEFQGGSNGSTD